MAETEMVERAARAIYHGKPRNRPWEILRPEFQRQYEKQARAAIEAMREPTDVMMAAIGQTSLQAKIWRVMIDAALSPPSKD